MDKVAVVILNYNGKKFLEKFLPIVVKYSAGHTIIVGDNGSTDDSVSWLQEHFPEVRIIKLPQNEGFSKGYNLVLDKVDAEYYVLLNSDVEVTENWIEPVIDLFEKEPSIVACQPKILSYYDKTSFEYAGAAGGFIDKYGYPFCRGRIFNTLEKDEGQYDDTREIFWATGACLFIRSSIYHQFKGFDDHFFAHMEEIDLCWRLNRAGFKVYYTHKSKVYHVGGGTLPKTNPRKTFLNFRNSLLMINKNLPLKQKREIILRKALIDSIAALKFLLTGNFGDFYAILKAYRHYFTISENEFKYIKLENRGKTSGENLNIFKGSVVVAYYLHGKKTFKNLRF